MCGKQLVEAHKFSCICAAQAALRLQNQRPESSPSRHTMIVLKVRVLRDATTIRFARHQDCIFTQAMHPISMI